MIPIIAHLDMNSYFASVEQQDNPAWRGKPVGVCEHLGGILIAASREAKRWGISTGTPVWEAKKLYPKILLTHTHPDRYRLYHNRFVKLVSDYTDHVEAYSIDEVFLDITKATNIRKLKLKNQNVKFNPAFPNSYLSSPAKGVNGGQLSSRSFDLNLKSSIFPPLEFDGELSRIAGQVNLAAVNPYEEAVRVILEIKRRMKKEVGDWLTVSAGVAPTKLLAKIASDLKKPDGLTLIENSKFKIQNLGTEHTILQYSKEELYTILKLTDIPGIASRQEKRLNALGIHTLKDLRDYPESKLITHFGILGKHLHSMGQLEGSWQPDVHQDQDIKSIGHMYTLPKQFRQKNFFVPVLYKLSEMVARRLRVQRLAGSTLHFHIHNGDHECFGKSKRLGYFVQDGREIFLESMKIFEQATAGQAASGLGEFKLIGVTMAGLKDVDGQQSLFERDERVKRVVKVLDAINQKYGDFTVCRVPVKQAGNIFRDTIGFGRIKEGVRLASFR